MSVIKGYYMKRVVSYSNFMRRNSNVLAIIFSILIACSCSNKNENIEFEKYNNIADFYRVYLSEIRKIGALPADSLASRLKEWRSIRDSVFIIINKDTLKPHSAFQEECRFIDDSIRLEFARMATSKKYSFSDVILVKEIISPYSKDMELAESADRIRPFFDSLDQAINMGKEKQNVLSCYRTLLTETLKDSIENIQELQEFIKKEDAMYRSFLVFLHDYSDTNLSDITHDTEKCCGLVFDAADRGNISYRDATIYMVLRNNRRLIQNVLICFEDIRKNRVHNREQAWVYACMILQPYVSMDGLCIALMSQNERYAIMRIASETPGALLALLNVIQSDKNRLSELPGMLLEILILTI